MTIEEAKLHLQEYDNAKGWLAASNQGLTDGAPVEGVASGRIVAYWPYENEGLRVIGNDPYIPAVITRRWSQDGSVVPCVQLHLYLDSCNQQEEIKAGKNGKSSCNFSIVPTQGHWTWIPKA